jgi:putative ABC transport system substrate-binding protein
MASYIARRKFLAALLGDAAAWPLAARAQGERMGRIGVLMNLGSDDAEGQARNAAFLQGLQELDWTVGRNSTRLGRVCRNLLRRHFPPP